MRRQHACRTVCALVVGLGLAAGTARPQAPPTPGVRPATFTHPDGLPVVVPPPPPPSAPTTGLPTPGAREQDAGPGAGAPRPTLPPTGAPLPPGYPLPRLFRGPAAAAAGPGSAATAPREPNPLPIEVPPPTPTDLPSPKGGEEGGAADEPIAESEPPAEAEPGAGVPSRRPTSVVLETLAPESVGIGQKFVYEITVRNLGKEPVFQVRVEDEVPEGATFLGGDPAPEASGNQLRWDLGALEAGGEKRIRVELRPTAEGEVRTRPTVTVSASAAVRARVTRPVLTAAVTGPARAEVGGEVVFRMQLTNSGTGPAERVRLHAELSPGLRHPHGQVVEAEVPELLPGASKTVELKTTAAAPGEQTCSLLVSAEGSPPAKGRAAVEVRQQRLRLALSGPGRGLVNAEPTFTLELTNPGAAPSGPVRLRAVLPEGLEFVSASDGGTYDRALRTVRWELPPQPPGPPRELSVRARAAAAGTWRVRAAAEADPVQGAAAEHAIEVEGIPALRFEVVDLEDVIEVGKETTYEIRIVNQGTGPCTNLKLAGLLSEGLAVTAVNSPVAHRTDGRHLLFDPYPRLSAKADLVLRVRVRGERPGDHRFRVQLSCDQISNPVVKEEATRFYRP